MDISLIQYIVKISFLCCIAISVTACASNKSVSSRNEEKIEKKNKMVPNIPYYFLAIHNEPFNKEQRNKLEEAYSVLCQMVSKADSYGIKLTIMLAPSWSDYLTENSEKSAKLKSWHAKGHEISAHHHSIYHPGKWDGYSHLNQTEAQAERQKIKIGREPETYLGTFDDFINKMKRINPDIQSGCLNDELNKKYLPDAIIYDTCSGFANYGKPGKRVHGFAPGKGKNEYITAGTYKGIERKWLAHHFMSGSVQAAKEEFNSMHSGVYGTASHSSKKEYAAFLAYLDFLHRVDPKGKMSKTVSKIIEEKLIPEQRIPDTLVNTVYENFFFVKQDGDIKK